MGQKPTGQVSIHIHKSSSTYLPCPKDHGPSLLTQPLYSGLLSLVLLPTPALRFLQSPLLLFCFSRVVAIPTSLFARPLRDIFSQGLFTQSLALRLAQAKMLAIFGSTVANGPQELCSPCSTPAVQDNRKSGTQILEAFVKEAPNAVQITLSDVGGMAYTHHKQALLRPRSFAAIDGVFCVFQGTLENLTALRQEYGLTKNVNEVMLIIQAYKTLRDRGPFPADKVLAALIGQFVFVLYDTSNHTVFVAEDCDGKVPFYWGTAADNSLAFSDTPEVLKAGCGKSFAPFPAGCYFSSNMGLRSYEHPLQKLKPVPRVDSQGQALGAGFKVDMSHKDHKDKESMHRVGSEANWAQSI